MTVTAKLLSDVINELYTCTPYVPEEGGFVLFGLDCGGYRAHVALHIFDKPEVKGQIAQAIGISFAFAKATGEEVDLQDKPFEKVLGVCNELQMTLDWSTITPCRLPNGVVEIALYRCFNTSTEDLQRACNGDVDSELLTAIFSISDEFETLCPVILSFNDGQITDTEHIQQLLDTPINSA